MFDLSTLRSSAILVGQSSDSRTPPPAQFWPLDLACLTAFGLALDPSGATQETGRGRMRILTRYVLAEFLKVFLVTLTSLTLLMLIVFLGKEAVDQGLGLPQVLRIIPYVLPNALLFTVPGTTLFAACLVYGRLSSSNEILAVKAVGISPMELDLALRLILSVFLSLLTSGSTTWPGPGAIRGSSAWCWRRARRSPTACCGCTAPTPRSSSRST